MATILIIDDDAGVRASIAHALKAANHDVFSAGNGKEGMRHFRAIQADLVITDIFMPEQDGLETIAEIYKKLPHVAILAISGSSAVSWAMLSVALQSGATAILEKPFDRETLLASVDKTLRMKRHVAKPDVRGEGPGQIFPVKH